MMRSTAVAAAFALLLLAAGSASAGRQLLREPIALGSAGRQLLSTGEPAVELGLAGNFTILAKAGISTVPSSVITGDIGVSPIASGALTGFSLMPDSTNVFSTSTQITGNAYAANYDGTTPTVLSTAVSNMEAAYTDAAGRVNTDGARINLKAGLIGGETLTPGIYTWSTDVSIIGGDLFINGSDTDIFIFQIATELISAAGTRVTLTGGALAKNIFWQVGGTVTFGAGTHFEGILLAKTAVIVKTESSINGLVLAQTAVTLDQATVTPPSS
jgi:hypothetical protein